ncbi:Methyltransferase domain-containing protein [Cladophialophora immunda]|nr:Methyltransferase domain-containing protein [Cladophialophora immunda]
MKQGFTTEDRVGGQAQIRQGSTAPTTTCRRSTKGQLFLYHGFLTLDSLPCALLPSVATASTTSRSSLASFRPLLLLLVSINTVLLLQSSRSTTSSSFFALAVSLYHVTMDSAPPPPPPPPPPDVMPENHYMTALEAQERFDRRADNYDFLYALDRLSLPYFIQVANLQSTETVLDLGCGIGWNAHLAAPRCRYVIGIDISGRCCQQAIQTADEQRLRNVAFAQADMTTVSRLRHGIDNAKALTRAPSGPSTRAPELASDIPDDVPHRFDVVLLCGVIQILVPERRRGLLCMIRDYFLRPHGRIVLTWPNPTTSYATHAIAYRIRPTPAPPRDTVKLTLKEFFGSAADEERAREDLQEMAMAMSLDLQPDTHSYPRWQELGMTNRYAEVLTLAREKAMTRHPDPRFIQLERVNRLNSAIRRLEISHMDPDVIEGPNDLVAYHRVHSKLQQHRERFQVVSVYSITQVLGVLTRQAH